MSFNRNFKYRDIVNVNFEDQLIQGEVEEVNNVNKTVKVLHTDNEYWYRLDDISPVKINIEQLLQLGFHVVGKEEEYEIYEKGPFTVKIGFSREDHPAILHYRDETREIVNLRYMHELQHHYKSMTNFELWNF
ncbi:MAG: hypothetical protein K9I82_03065 [Chitinophagaceae bacterium]|nr:hypothetical protein [Chitinophagaceae bacterium]